MTRKELRGRFADLYFTYRLGGNAEDFYDAATAFAAARRGGVGVEVLQAEMEAARAAVLRLGGAL